MAAPVKRTVLLTGALLFVCLMRLAWQQAACPAHDSVEAMCRVGESQVPVPSKVPSSNITLSSFGQAARASSPSASRFPGGLTPLVLVRKPAEAPAWALPFGSEFWHPRSPAPALSSVPQLGASGLGPERVGDVIDRVAHVFEPTPNRNEVQVADVSYRATVDGNGLCFMPAVPADDTARNTLASANEHTVKARFRTCAVRRRLREVYSGATRPSNWCVTGNTAQSLLDNESGLLEHYEARSSGVEVAWVVPRPLPGQGDLVIEAELVGLTFAGQTPSGYHFADSQGVARVKVGSVIAMDQSGQRWPARMQVAGSACQVVVPEEVLVQASLPLAIDPLISAEFGLDQPVGSSTPSTRAEPAVAANASGYLVVWTHAKGTNTDAAVAAARVSEAGVLLDPYGLAISSQASEQTVCAVAANPSQFLVVWAAPGTLTTDWDILGARVRADGTVVDSTPLPVCALSSSLQASPAVAGNGNNFLVAWRDSRDSAIYGTIVRPDGGLSVTNGFLLGEAPNDQYTPAVASLGTNYLVVWQDYRNSTEDADMYGARVTGSGLLLDTNGLAISTRAYSQFHPSVAADGTNYLVVWEDHDLGGNDICGARVTLDGVVLDTNAIAICHAANAQINPAVAAVGGDFLVVWQDYRDSPASALAARIYGTRVHDDGSVVDSNGVAFTTAGGEGWSPAVAGLGAGFLAVWQDSRNNLQTTLTDIYGALGAISNELALNPDWAVSGSANAELSPAAAALGTNFLVVWADTRACRTNGLDIYGVRLDQNGGVLDPTAIPICTATNDQVDPTVAANGTNCLVVWSDRHNTPANVLHGDIYGALVSASGALLQTNGFAICTATNDQTGPAVVPLGTNFLVVWQDARASLPTAARWDIYGARVTTNGQVLEPFGIPICTTIPAQTNVAVAASPTQALAVWTDFRYSAVYPHIFGSRIGLDGSVLDPGGLAICTAAYQQSSVATAADDHGYFVVWCDWRSSASGSPDIYGAAVGADGSASPANGFPIRVASGYQIAPAVAFNGADYLVTWQESHNGLSNSFDIFGVLVGSEWPSELGPLLQIDANGFNHAVPAVAAGADGRFLVFNQGYQSLMRRTAASLVNPEAIPRLDFCAWLSNGQFQFRFSGAVGERYAIEVSADLHSWSQLWMFTNAQSSAVLTDPTATNSPSRFYRALLLP
jgi:hypothetical protein